MFPQGEPSASVQDLSEESCKVVCDLSLILGDDNTDGARVGNNICATILQPSVTKSSNSDQTRDPDF